MSKEEEEKVSQYLIDHSMSNFFIEYNNLGLSVSTNQKIETIKLLIE